MIAEPDKPRGAFGRWLETLHREQAEGAAKPPQPPPPDEPRVDEKRIRIRVDERGMHVAYANAFRTIATPEECMLDFGVAEFRGRAGGGAIDVKITAGPRLVMSYHSAKRLAIMVGELIRRHEERFGAMDVKIQEFREGANPAG